MTSELSRLRSENKCLKQENAQIKSELDHANQRLAEVEQRQSESEALIVKLTEKLEHLEYIISYKRKRRPKADLEEQDDDGAGAERSKRSPGGQPGHPGRSRKRPTRIDVVKDHKPGMCPDCIVPIEDPEFAYDRYTEDLIFPRTWNTLHRIWSGACPCCGKVVYGAVTEALPNHQLGLRVELFAAYQHFILRLPYNKIRHELKTYFGLKVAESTLVNAVTELADLYGPEYEELKERMRFASIVFSDETGWKVNGDLNWLWAFINRECALYVIRKSRGSKVPKEILGEDFKGAFVSDFWRGYSPLHYEKMQKCCTHLLGETKRFTEIKEKKKRRGAKESRRLHERLKKLIREAVEFDLEMLERAAAIEAGPGPPELDPDPGDTLDIPAARKAKRCEFEERLDSLIGKKHKDPDCVRIAKRLKRHRDEIFLFVEMEDVEYTNNRAERGIRPSVVLRKITGGNRSERGARSHEVLMSIMQTQMLQGKDFFTEAPSHIQRTVFPQQMACR